MTGAGAVTSQHRHLRELPEGQLRSGLDRFNGFADLYDANRPSPPLQLGPIVVAVLPGQRTRRGRHRKRHGPVVSMGQRRGLVPSSESAGSWSLIGARSNSSVTPSATLASNTLIRLCSDAHAASARVTTRPEHNQQRPVRICSRNRVRRTDRGKRRPFRTAIVDPA
jgi:hypothetical protein